MNTRSSYIGSAIVATSLLLSACGGSSSAEDSAASEVEDFFTSLPGLIEDDIAAEQEADQEVDQDADQEAGQEDEQIVSDLDNVTDDAIGTETNTDNDISNTDEILDDDITDTANAVTGSGTSTELAYSNGFVLESALLQTPNGEDKTISFEVDTEANTLTHDDTEFNTRFDEFVYDDEGRVVEFFFKLDPERRDSFRFVTHNDDGTIAQWGFQFGEELLTTKFEYEDGNLVRSTDEVSSGTEVTRGFVILYLYDSEGNLTNAGALDDDTGEIVTTSGWNYTNNDSGQISEVNTFGINTSADLSRFLFTYDVNGNIIRYETFSESGELIEDWTFTYVEATEPMPNMMGFQFFLDTGFNAF